MLIVHSSLLPSSIRYINILHLFVYSSVRLWIVSDFWLFNVKLLWTFMYKSLHGWMLLFLLGKHLGVEWLHQMVVVCLTFKWSVSQFSCSVVSDSLRPGESQHARLPCPSPTPGVHSDSRPSSQWCHPAISTSVVHFSSCPNPSQHQSLFQWVNSSLEVAKVLEFQL